jgi:hypothetical protein
MLWWMSEEEMIPHAEPDLFCHAASGLTGSRQRDRSVGERLEDGETKLNKLRGALALP